MGCGWRRAVRKAKWHRRSKPSPARLVTISNSDVGSGAKTSLMTVPHVLASIGYSWNVQKNKGLRGSTATQL